VGSPSVPFPAAWCEVGRLAARFNADPIKLLDTLKATVFAAARNNEELQALVIVANQYNLNPLTKEIYAFPAKGGGIVPVVSVDGWINLANSHPQMDGVDFEWDHDEQGKLISCTCVVYRKDRSRPTRVTEYLIECKRQTEPWKMEHRMLRHKAFCQGVRVAFGFSGIIDDDEAERIRDVTPPSATTSKLFRATTPETPLPVQDDACSPELGSGASIEKALDAADLEKQLEGRLINAKINWTDVLTTLHDNGLIGPDYISLYDAPESLLKLALDNWLMIVKLLAGGDK
jgi:hypothetical protein